MAALMQTNVVLRAAPVQAKSATRASLAAPHKAAALRSCARLAATRRSVVMRSAATDEIIEKMKTLTLLEAAELVKQIETTFGVDASAPAGGMMMAAGPAAAAEEVEVQTEFNLSILDCAADKRIAAIKVVRSLTSLGLKEAKDAVTTVPFLLLEAKSKADVDKAKAELEAAGCKCEIK